MFAVVTCVEQGMTCSCALARVMNFALARGKYTLLVPSLPRGSIYRQSPVSPPELFNPISNSYKRCLRLEWRPSSQTSHLLRNGKL